MNRREAIRECKRLWKEINESGMNKTQFLMSPAGLVWCKKLYICPLCDYLIGDAANCSQCPLMVQYGKDCVELGYDDKSRSREFFDAVAGLKVHG